jgi:phosphoglycerate dehydrogenase-like enzyme
MHVHLLRKTKAEAVNVLRSNLDPSIKLTVGEVDEGHKATTMLIAGRPSREELAYFPKLEALIIPWIGIPPETLALVQEFSQLDLHNLHHNAEPTAEMAVALLLAAAKRIIPYDQALRSHDWRFRYQKSSEILLLDGKKALILGYGAIGKRIGSALGGLGIDVSYIRRNAGNDPNPKVYSPDALESLLPTVDFLLLALPLTSETEGWIGEDELRLLPPTAVLVNVARAAVIDEAALFKALNEKWIFGAGLDVWFNYPKTEEERLSAPPGNYPWHTLDNLVLSPHRAGHVRETEQMRMTALAEVLNEGARGNPLPNKVDTDLGY